MKTPWDHAFASGATSRETTLGWAPLVDPLFGVVERWYGNYCIRRNWRLWKTASVCGPGVRLGANTRLVNKNAREAVRVGANTVCKGIFRVERDGKLSIGDEVYVGDGTIISSANSVEIGSGTLIAHGVQIFDNTSHPLSWQERQSHFRSILGQKLDQNISIPSAPVRIGEHCWLGFGSIVLKGVTIGDRSIVGAGCVVTKSVPPDTLVVGPRSNFIDLPGNGEDG